MPMTVRAGSAEGGSDLEGCPAAEAVAWVVEHSRRGAAAVDGATLLRYVVVEPDLADPAADYLHRWTEGWQAIDEVLGWRQLSDERVAIRYLATDGCECELSWRVTQDGRLEDQIQRREDAAARVEGARTHELTADQRAQVHAVFAATYHDPDPSYLDAQLESLQGIGLAIGPAGVIVGFTLYGWRELDLPAIGRHGVGLPGLACVHPDARRHGIAGACGMAAGQVAVKGPLHLAVTKMATPASLRMVLRSVPVGSWPTSDDPLALYRNPSQTQLAVTAELARAHGCEAADGAVGIGRGRSIGRPKIEPEVTAEQAALFQRVDRHRGDSLLWVAWLTTPPPEWFV